MGILEIIFAIILIIACVFIIIVVLMKDTKTKMSQTISGTSSDSYFGKNSGRTKDAMLNKATIIAAVVFFVLSLTVNVINLKFGGKSDSDTSSVTSIDTSSDTSSDGENDAMESILDDIFNTEQATAEDAVDVDSMPAIDLDAADGSQAESDAGAAESNADAPTQQAAE